MMKLLKRPGFMPLTNRPLARCKVSLVKYCQLSLSGFSHSSMCGTWQGTQTNKYSELETQKFLDLWNVCVRGKAWLQPANGRVLHQRSNQSIFRRTSHYASTRCSYYKDHNVGWNILFCVSLGIRDSIFLVHADSLP